MQRPCNRRGDGERVVILLDGALATELQRHGVPVAPPWLTSETLRTARGRDLLRGIHAEYIEAGAQVITANTFRTNLRAMRRAGLDDAGAARMVEHAVAAARRARDDAGAPWVRVAASLAPVEDCYRPALAPPPAELHAEHRWMAGVLAGAGVDLVLIETMNSQSEATIALAQVRAAGIPAWVSFVCADGARLLSGEDLGVAARRVESAGAEAVLVNCTRVDRVAACLRRLREVCHGPIGVYPNVEDRGALPDWTHVEHRVPTAHDADSLAALVERWLTEYGVDMVGGCCGSSPAHIARLRAGVGGVVSPPSGATEPASTGAGERPW